MLCDPPHAAGTHLLMTPLHAPPITSDVCMQTKQMPTKIAPVVQLGLDHVLHEKICCVPPLRT